LYVDRYFGTFESCWRLDQEFVSPTSPSLERKYNSAMVAVLYVAGLTTSYDKPMILAQIGGHDYY
jgi:hypothetical protein